MSEQLWTIIRAVANALPREVIPSCQWLVLSPAMIAEQGLPMDDRSDVGWPFHEVIEARQRRFNLLCARTKHRVNYQEYFEAADMDHCVVDASAHTQRSTFSEQKDPDRASMSASAASAAVQSPSIVPTEANWTWPAAAALRDNGDDTADKKRWYWRAVAGANSVSKRTFFSEQSSHQLELVLSHWITHSTPMSTLRVERGDQQLAQVWRDLDKGGQEVEGICFDGRHGGLLQITAPTADGWVELSRVRKGAKTEYPRMWNWNDGVKVFLGW